MDGWIYGGRPSSKEIQFSLYSDDHIGDEETVSKMHGDAHDLRVG